MSSVTQIVKKTKELLSGFDYEAAASKAAFDIEVADRVEKLSSAIQAWSDSTKELEKIKPDVGASYGPNGEVISKAASYSKGRADERQKIAKQVKRLEDAIDAAVKDKDFSKLNEVNT